MISKAKKKKIKKVTKKKILPFPKIYNVNRILNNNMIKKKNALNIQVDNIDMPNDFIYYQKNIIIIANLWNTNKLMTKRLTHSSKIYKDLITDKNELDNYNIVKEKKCCLENNNNPTIQDYYTKASLLDASKEDGKRRFIDDIFTEFNTINFLATMESRIRFLKLIITTFNIFFDKIYKLDNKFNSNNLNIMAKGGTLIRFIIMEYIRGFSKEIQDFILNDIKKNIKLSDYDFEIMTNTKDLTKEDFVQLNVLTYILTIHIKNYLYKNKYFFFDFFKLSEKTRVQEMNKLKMKLQKEINDKSPSLNDNSLYKNIIVDYIDFDGCYSNKILTTNYKNNNIDLKKYKSLTCSENTFGNSINIFCKNDYGIIADASKKGSKRKVKSDEIYMIDSINLFKKYDIPNNITKHILYPYKSKMSDNPGRDIFNRFVASHNPLVDMSNDNEIIKFQLNRIKYTYNIYFRKNIEINGIEKIIFIRHPILGEVFDLSHAYIDDRKKKKFDVDFRYNTNFKPYKFLNYDLDFISYSIEGNISDLDSIIFDETNFKPWEDIKYAKRLKRILYLYIFYFFSNKVKINDRYKLKDIKYLISLVNNDFNNYRKTSINTDSSIILRLFDILYKTSFNKKDPKYIEYKNELLSMLNNFYMIYTSQIIELHKQNFNVGLLNLNNNLLNIDFPKIY